MKTLSALLLIVSVTFVAAAQTAIPLAWNNDGEPAEAIEIFQSYVLSPYTTNYTLLATVPVTTINGATNGYSFLLWQPSGTNWLWIGISSSSNGFVTNTVTQIFNTTVTTDGSRSVFFIARFRTGNYVTPFSNACENSIPKAGWLKINR